MDNASTDRRAVLVTGAAGRIGSAFWRDVGDRYRLRLAERDADRLSDAADAGHEVVAFDTVDLGACRAACRGIDTVVHLAAKPSPDADFYGSLLDANVMGAFNVFQAAADEGCRRLVFASSVHAVVGYPDDTPVRPEWPVRPTSLYGVTKCFGEALAAHFSTRGLSCVAVRIGAYDAPWSGERPRRQDACGYVSRRDLSQLLVLCIEAEGIPFAIVHGVSDNHPQRLDLTETRRLLGYEPQDDGYLVLPEDEADSQASP